MPCQISDWEIKIIEKEDNQKHYGISASDSEIATTVACQLGRLYAGHEESETFKALPVYVQKWLRKHWSDDAKKNGG